MKILIALTIFLYSTIAIADQEVYNGEPVKRSQYKFEVDYYPTRCSATIVSENVVITAAHCVRKRNRRVQTLKLWDGRKFKVRFTKSPWHRGVASGHDMALGLIDGKVELDYYPALVASISKGENVTILGYGRPHLGELHRGFAKVLSMRGKYEFNIRGTAHYGGGDSGGGTFVTNPHDGRLLLAGINSKRMGRTSLAVRIDTHWTRDFLERWMRKNPTALRPDVQALPNPGDQ